MGVLMRLYIVIEPLKFNYKFLTHAHSHVALLGWVYLGLTTLIYYVFLREAEKSKLYKRIFLVTNISILGMQIAFPIQGYAVVSIIFSTLFLFVSYWFAWFAMKYVPEHFKSRFSWTLVKASLWYLVLSSIGPWAIGGVMSTLGSESSWYKTSIYFYLHFQYNGWFILALLGVFFYILEERGVEFDQRKLKSFFFILNVGVVLTLFLSVLWFKPPKVFYVLGMMGAIVQAQAFYELYQILKPKFSILKSIFSKIAMLLLRIASVLIAFKLLMQFMSGHSHYANLVVVLKDFVIGYLHMVFLGIVIPVMFVFLNYFKLLRLSKTFVYSFLFTVGITEILIFYKGIALWLKFPLTADYYTYLAVLSCLFPIVVGILLINNIQRSYLSAYKNYSNEVAK